MKAKMIKFECMEQNQYFKHWDSQKRYGMFHHSHYDWWAFPINQPSSHGDKYQIGQKQFYALQSDNQFISALRSNSILVCKSWGYSLIQGQQYSQVQRNNDQRWQQWPIRLYKMAKSLQLFGQNDLFKHAIRYGKSLIDDGHRFVYSMKKLNEYFEQNSPVSKKTQSKQIIETKKEYSKSVYKNTRAATKQAQLARQNIPKSPIKTILQSYTLLNKNNIYKSHF